MRLLFVDHFFQYPEIPALAARELGAELLEFKDDTELDWGDKFPSPHSPADGRISPAAVNEYVWTFTQTRSRWYRIGQRIMNNRSTDWNLSTLRNQAMHFLNFAFAWLDKHQVDVVILSRLPHTGIDFSFWTAAQAAGLPTFFFLQSPFPYRFMMCQSMEDIGRFSVRQAMREAQAVHLKRTSQHQWFYMQPPVTKSIVNKILERPIRASLKRGGEIAWQKSLEIGSARNRQANRAASASQRRYELDLAEYAREPTAEELASPYVYFAFHLEPESSTVPRAGEYSDQLLALERLSQICPSGWKILAKENPKQNHYGRDSYFFARLRNLSNVVFVSTETSSGELIESAKLVASINGTVGWEAICGGKPALYFGNPWYRELTGANAFDPGLDIRQLGSSSIDHALLERQVSEIQSKMLRGVIFKKYEAICPNFDRQQNIQDAAEDIALYLTRNGFLPA